MERDPVLDEARLQLVARVEHVRHEVGRHRHVVEIALLEREEARIRLLDDADLDAAHQRQLPAAKLRERTVVGKAAFGIELVAKRRIRLQHDPLSAPPLLEAERPGAHGIRHHPARAVRVRFDHLARDRGGSDGREIGQELVVGEIELELQRVAVDRLQALHRRVVVELARFLRFRDDGLGADEAPVEALQRVRAHPRIEHALHPVHVVGGGQLAPLALEHRVVGEPDAGPDAYRPRLAVGRDVGHARRGVRDELVRSREVVVLVERVEDRATDAVRILVARRLRIESGLGRRGTTRAAPCPRHPVPPPARRRRRGRARRARRRPRRPPSSRSPYSTFSMSGSRLAGSAFGA